MKLFGIALPQHEVIGDPVHHLSAWLNEAVLHVADMPVRGTELWRQRLMACTERRSPEAQEPSERA